MTTGTTGPEAGALLAAVAEEVRAVGTRIEQLAGLLIADARFVADYVDEFQVFDLMSQCADESAGVLDRLARGVPAEDAVARVRLTAVQQRLSAAISRT